jgi:hypothetical protein
LKAIRSNFLANYSENVSVASLVSRVGKQFIAEKRQELWEAHRTLIVSMIQEMTPAAAREFEGAIAKLMTETGELRDEELVRLYRAGFPEGKAMLLERYATKLHQDMQKAPDRVRGMPHFSAWKCVAKSGGSGSKFLDCDLLFCAESVFHLVTVLPAACLIEFVRA